MGEGRAVRLALRLVAVGYVTALVAVPVGAVVARTFAHGLTPVLVALTDPDLVAAARLGLLVTGVSVAVNTVSGVGLALLLARGRFPGRRLLGALVDLPLATSPVVIGTAIVLVYGRSGLLGGWLEAHGARIVFATPGVVLATVVVSLPLVVREVLPVLEAAGTEQDEAAACLGANAGQRFVRITLPTIRWALAYGAVLALARSLGEFGAVRVVSASVAGESQTPTLFVADAHAELGPAAEQAAFTAAFALLVVAAAFVAVIAWLRPHRAGPR